MLKAFFYLWNLKVSFSKGGGSSRQKAKRSFYITMPHHIYAKAADCLNSIVLGETNIWRYNLVTSNYIINNVHVVVARRLSNNGNVNPIIYVFKVATAYSSGIEIHWKFL